MLNRWRMSPSPGCSPEPADGDEVVSVPAVFPAALFGDSLEDLDSRAPSLLRCLWQVAIGEFLSGLRQEMCAGLLILLGVHLGLLLLFLEVSNCSLPWQLCRRGLHDDVRI